MQNTINSMTGLRIDMDPPYDQFRNNERSSAFTAASMADSTTAQPSNMTSFSMRSTKGMAGLLAAEVGASMVELDAYGDINGSGFKEGKYISPANLTPLPVNRVGGTRLPVPKGSRISTGINRRSTLLSRDAPSSRNAAELKSLLGNSRARVKAGAAVCSPPGALRAVNANRVPQIPYSRGQDTMSLKAPLSPLVLEQGKSRSRVEIDIALETAVCVEGGHLNGHVHIKVNKPSRKNSHPVCLSDGKIRIAGFEVVPRHGTSSHSSNADVRHIFYQATFAMGNVALNTHYLYTDPVDDEGFAYAREGTHSLPFTLKLPTSNTSVGCPKGVLNNCSGAMIRYIIIASIKLKNPVTNKRSVAHFYRNIEIWPILSLQTTLQKSPNPFQSTASKTLFMGGPNPLKLTALLHRRTWVAGQRCYVRILVENESKKMVKSVSIALIRTLVIFKPRKGLDNVPERAGDEDDPDACQTATSEKVVAETTLNKGQKGSRGLVSAKGWWTGVEPGEYTSFTHDITLPADAHTIPRSRLLEVEYAIRVSLSAGSLASDVSVSLPIKIVNFLSLDPPPSAPMGTEGMIFGPESSVKTASQHSSSISPYSAPSQYSSSSPEKPITSEQINLAGRGSYLGRTRSQPAEVNSSMADNLAAEPEKSFRSRSFSTKGRDGLPSTSDPFDKAFPWRANESEVYYDINDMGAVESAEEIASVLGDDGDIPGSSSLSDETGEEYLAPELDEMDYFEEGLGLVEHAAFGNGTIPLYHDGQNNWTVPSIEDDRGSDEELQFVVGSAKLEALEWSAGQHDDQLQTSSATNGSKIIKNTSRDGTGYVRPGSAVRGPRVPQLHDKFQKSTDANKSQSGSTPSRIPTSQPSSNSVKSKAKISFAPSPIDKRRTVATVNDGSPKPKSRVGNSSRQEKESALAANILPSKQRRQPEQTVSGQKVKSGFASRVNEKLQNAVMRNDKASPKPPVVDAEENLEDEGTPKPYSTPLTKMRTNPSGHIREGASIDNPRHPPTTLSASKISKTQLPTLASFTPDQKSLVDGILRSAALTSSNSSHSPTLKPRKASPSSLKKQSLFAPTPPPIRRNTAPATPNLDSPSPSKIDRKNFSPPKIAALNVGKPKGSGGGGGVRSKIAELEERVRQAEMEGRPDFNRAHTTG